MRVVGSIVAVKRSISEIENFIEGVRSSIDMPHKHCTPLDMEPSDSESSSFDAEGGNMPDTAPEGSNMPEKQSVGPPAWLVEANVCFGVASGTGVSTRASAGGGGAAATPKTRPRTKGPSWQAPKCPFKHQKCRLYDHLYVFETCSGLNVHHGWYYSAKGDCFIPIPEVDQCARQVKVRQGQQHRWSQAANPPFRPKAGPGKTHVDTPML